jgi:hypothetical protein
MSTITIARSCSGRYIHFAILPAPTSPNTHRLWTSFNRLLHQLRPRLDRLDSHIIVLFRSTSDTSFYFTTHHYFDFLHFPTPSTARDILLFSSFVFSPFLVSWPLIIVSLSFACSCSSFVVHFPSSTFSCSHSIQFLHQSILHIRTHPLA